MSYTLPIDLAASFPAGTFIDGSAKMMEAIVNTAWELGNTKATSFETKIANSSSWIDPAHPPAMTAATVTVPTVAEPAVAIPTSVSQTDILATFDTKYLELVQLLSDKFVAFRTSYFPDESAAYTAAEDWLQAALADPSGLPPTVAAQVWEDDRSRILADADRASADVLATFATKRFPLPPGAAANAVLQIQQKAQDEMAESSRKVAVMSIENLRFAVEKTLSLRGMAMDAAIKYISALASGPDLASRVVSIGYDAQSKLISAAAQFYNARTEATKLTYTANQHNADLTQEAGKANLQSELSVIEDKLKALLAEAQSLAQMATALFNNVHAQAGMSNSVQSQTSTTV